MRSLWLLNILLVLVALVLLEGVVSVAVDRPSMIFAERRTADPPAKAAAIPKTEADPPARRSEVSPLAELAVIVDKELFRNPNPEPVAPTAGSRGAPPAPSLPLPALIGTIFVGDERKAVLRDNQRTESYGLGQNVGGGTLKTIESDRVVIERNGTQVEVLLKASFEPAGAAKTGGRAAPGRPAPPAEALHGDPGPAPPAPAPAPVAPAPRTGPTPFPAPASRGVSGAEAEAPVTAGPAAGSAAPTGGTAIGGGPASRLDRIRRVREGLERRNQLRQSENAPQ